MRAEPTRLAKGPGGSGGRSLAKTSGKGLSEIWGLDGFRVYGFKGGFVVQLATWNNIYHNDCVQVAEIQSLQGKERCCLMLKH